MPELPEVETVRRSLEPILLGKTILQVVINYSGIIKKPDPSGFRAILEGRSILGVGRRGKYLLFKLSGNYTLVIHLRMTGQLVLVEKGRESTKHTHLIFHLNEDIDLHFVDIRKFGMVYLIPTEHWNEIGGLAGLGPEPLSADFTQSYLEERISAGKGNLKSFLLDQSQIAGIGNIYADEILFEAGLHPERLRLTLSGEEIERLYLAINLKIKEGIEYRGTSIRDYVDGRGEKGGFQDRLKVYDRGGKNCVKCGNTLIKGIVAGRGTVYCPNCQH